MKKVLTLLGLVPFMASAQSFGGVGSLVGFVIALAFAFAIFFLPRGIIVWYFKIDEIVNNLNEQIRIMKAILDRMEKKEDNSGEI